MANVCLLMARFGPWPGWFPFTMRTLEANDAHDFYLLGDVFPHVHLPKNVRFMNISRADLDTRVHAVIGKHVRHALTLTREPLIAHAEQNVSAEQIAHFSRHVSR
eukprot:6204777-Pleurochrysis_carterae.AAC.13